MKWRSYVWVYDPDTRGGWMKNFRVRLEWKPQDLWVGAFWKRSGGCGDLWVCLIPCVPIHVSWGNRDGIPLSKGSAVLSWDHCALAWRVSQYVVKGDELFHRHQYFKDEWLARQVADLLTEEGKHQMNGANG